MIKGIIFSFDNVLLDSRYLQKKSFQSALREYGYFWTPEMEKDFENRRSPNRLDYMISTRQVRKEDVDMIEYAIASHQDDMMSECKISESMKDVFKSLKERGIKLAIASDSNRARIINFLKWTRLNEFFDFVTTSDGKFKPDPDVYSRTLQKMELDPSQVLVFEGSQTGIGAAYSAGIKSCRMVTARSLENHLFEATKR